MESDPLKRIRKFPSPFFWGLGESMFAIVHEKLIRWKCSEADHLAWHNTTAFLSYARENDPVKSRRQFQEVLDQDPGNLVALTSLAYIDVKHSDVASAETKRKTLAELNESGGETEVQKRWAAAMFEKAFCLTRFGQGRHREALGCIKQALKYDSENKEWLKTETFLLTKHVDSKALAQVHPDEIETYLERAAANVLKLQQLEPDSGEVLCMTAELFEAARSTDQGRDWMKAYKRRNLSQIVDISVLYEQAYELCPKDQSVCRKAVLHLKNAHKWEKMEKILTKALKDFPSDSLLYHQYGLRYLMPFLDAMERQKNARGKAKKSATAKVKETSTSVPRAEEYFQKGLELEPRFTRCRIKWAQCLYYQGKVPESRQQLRIAVEKAKDTREKDEARRELAKLSIEEDDDPAELMKLCEAPQFEGQVIESSLGKACVWDDKRVPGLVKEGVGSHDKPFDCDKQALEINNDTVCVAGRGQAAKHSNQDQSLEPAVLFDEACRPVDRYICRKAVLHFKDTREWQKMEEILKKALKYFPNDQLLYHQYGLRYLIPCELALADARETKGKDKKVAESIASAKIFLPKAEEYLQKALMIDPLFTRCRTSLVRCLYYQGKVQESRQQFHIATEEFSDISDVIEVRRNWVWLLIQKGDESEALMQLCEALKLKDRGVPNVYRGLDTALDSWCKVDKHNPKPVRVRAAFALETGREDKAIRYYEHALQINNNDTLSMVGIGRANRAKGREYFEEAKRWFEKACCLGNDKAGDELTKMERELMRVKDMTSSTEHFPQTVGLGIVANPLNYKYEDSSDSEEESIQGATGGHSAPHPNQWAY